MNPCDLVGKPQFNAQASHLPQGCLPLVKRVPTKQLVDQILLVTSHINCMVVRCLINVVYLTACAFILHFLNDVANDAESTQTSKITS